MPERSIDTGFWNDPFFQTKSFISKGFYVYAWTNVHVNQAGLYEITMLTMSRETNLDQEVILETIKDLYPKIEWFPEHNLLWVKAFIKRQGRSPKFLTAAGKCLKEISDPEIIEKYLRYYQRRYKLEIPYRYPIDTLSIPSAQEEDQRSRSGSISSSISSSISHSNISEERGSGGEKQEYRSDPKLAAIATLYEQNIGLVTPMIVERLIWIRDNYPEGWFQSALAEALKNEKRSLSYVEAIMERWSKEGYLSKRNNNPRAGNKGKLPKGVTIDNE